MVDDIQKIIYKLELDDSGYTKGVDSLANSTKKLTAEQEQANKALQTNEAALKAQSEFLQQTKKDLDSYTGTNERYRQQLIKSNKDAQADNVKLTELVNKNRVAYEAATKSAQDFANASAKASQLQQQTTGGKIPTATPVGITSQISSIVNVQDFNAVNAALEKTQTEFKDLAVAIGIAEQRMTQIDSSSDEFKQLSVVVSQGKVVLEDYAKATQVAGGQTMSLKGQLRQAKEELVKMEEAGLGSTKQYIELELRTAKLSDAISDQNQRIKILSSDTKALDFGKAAITAATSGFQALTAVQILAGSESSELQKKTMQLFAAMQLLQSLEQLSNLTRREGILSTLGLSGATKIYDAVVGSATGSLKTFKLALASTGIGAAIIAIGFIVKKFREQAEAAAEASRAQKQLQQVIEKSSDSYGKAVVDISSMTEKIHLAQQGFIDQKDVLKEYNETIGKTVGFTDDLNVAEQNIIDHGDEYIELTYRKARAEAAGALAAEAAKTEIEDKVKTTGKEINSVSDFIDRFFTNDPIALAAKKKKKALEEDAQTTKDFLALQNKELADAAAYAKEHGLSFNPKPNKETKNTPVKTVDNVFAEEKAKLESDLSALRNSQAESIKKINNEFAAKLEVERLRITKLIKDKKLTGSISDPKSQAGIIFGLSVQVNNEGLQKALEDFNKAALDAQDKLQKQLRDLHDKNTLDSINLMQDEFDKSAALINFNEQKELALIATNTDERLAALDHDKLLLSEQQYQDAKLKIINEGDDAVINLELDTARKRSDLAADTFNTFFDFVDEEVSRIDLVKDEEIAAGIQRAKKAFLSGEISQKEFESRIAKIKLDAANKAKADTLFVQESELKDLQVHLDAIVDKESKAYKDLLKRRDQIRKDIAAGKSDTSDTTENGKRVETVADYAQAVGTLTDSIVSFWQHANEAESQALDKSISLQEKRVDAAQRIAARGNAQYLKQEEDRLKELQIQKENAARKELAINAALQASQLLVGITGAISKIATPGVGIAETIGAIATIFAALATGYGLVKSLQGSQPKLAKGTKRVTRDGHPSGVDTIPAWLNEGEAVIPTEKNKAYHPAISAIYDGTIPAEHLNHFVNTYHKVKSVPQPNYSRIKDAAELQIGSDGKLAILLQENNDLQRQTLRAMKSMSVSANIDRNGVSIMVNEYIEQSAKDKRI